MADVAISALSAASALTGTEAIPVVQTGTTVRTTPNAIGTLLLAPTISRVSGSDFTMASATLTDVTGLTFAASANKIYRVYADLFGNMSTTNGMRAAFNFSAAGAVGFSLQMGLGGPTSGSTSISTLNQQPATNYWTTSGTELTLQLLGDVLVGANAGNITVQVARLTAGTLTIRIGSTMFVTQLN